MDRFAIHCTEGTDSGGVGRKLIFTNGAADRRRYETAVLATLRERLRGSNIWVE